jgi:hypothetical protein
MASKIFQGFVSDLLAGRISLATDTFKVMLVHGYAPEDTHARRADAARFEVSATGYDKGGSATSCTTQAGAGSTNILFSDVQWTVAGRLAATGAVIYKSRGGPASEDELVSYLDFGSEHVASNSTFSVHFADGIALRHAS